MPVPQTQRGAASHRKLLAAAEEELIERAGALEIASVADRAGVSTGLIYRWFDSRRGLIVAVVEAFYDRLDAAIIDSDPAPGGTWAERERARTELAVGFHYDDPLAPVVLSWLAGEPGVSAIEARRLSRQIGAATLNLKRGQERGEIPPDLDPELVGAMVLGGTREVLRHALARRRRPRRDVVTEELWRFIAAAVRIRPDKRRRSAQGALRET